MPCKDFMIPGRLEIIRLIYQRQLQDFPDEGGGVGQQSIIWSNFAENCMKMKKIGPRGLVQNFTI